MLDTQEPADSLSLDDRRPTTLDDFVGNLQVVQLVRQLMLAGVMPRRVFIYGPSGAGKTTLAYILIRYQFCPNRKGIGKACMGCASCIQKLASNPDLHEWTGADLNDQWSWWLSHRSTLDRENYTFFLDESQGLSRQHQKTLHRDFESAKATIILATTHRHEMDDALINRFDPNIYELHRPQPEESEEYLLRKCGTLGLKGMTSSQLAAIAAHYQYDMRKCVNFLYAAKEDLPDGLLTDDYIQLRLGIRVAKMSDHAQPRRRRPRL